jgi:hypothetical protein
MIKTSVATSHGVRHSVAEVENWLDLLRVFSGLEGWVFRGQECDWPLDPSLRRYVAGLSHMEAEDAVVTEAKRRVHHYLTHEHTPHTPLEWLALVQHHGGPTRLLDWTLSPYIATFFALEGALSSAVACELWAVNPGWCEMNAIEAVVTSLRVSKQRAGELVKNISKLDQSDFLTLTRSNLSAVVPARPEKLNERLVLQQGTFLCQLDVSTPFLNNFASPRTDSPKHVWKIHIPRQLRAIGLERLGQMNVNRATLFPGLDGFIQSLRQLVVREDPDERQRRIAIERTLDGGVRDALSQTVVAGTISSRARVGAPKREKSPDRGRLRRQG